MKWKHAGVVKLLYTMDSKSIARKSVRVGLPPPAHYLMPKAKLPDKDFGWTPELAYVIGLLTTDGNLSKDGRHLAMRSSDLQLLRTFKKCLNLNNKIIQTKNDQWAKRPCYILQFGNVQLSNYIDGCLKLDYFLEKLIQLEKLRFPMNISEIF